MVVTGEDEVMIKAGAVTVRGVTMVGILLAKRPRGGDTLALLISSGGISVGLVTRKVLVLRAFSLFGAR